MSLHVSLKVLQRASLISKERHVDRKNQRALFFWKWVYYAIEPWQSYQMLLTTLEFSDSRICNNSHMSLIAKLGKAHVFSDTYFCKVKGLHTKEKKILAKPYTVFWIFRNEPTELPRRV